VPAQVLAARIDALLDGELSPLGFEKVQPRRWVESKHPPLRKLFEFQAFKGESYSARWGFALDFVPVLRGEKLRWKHTAKTTTFDLCIDPIDTGRDHRDWPRLSRSIWPAKTYDWDNVTRTVRNAAKAARPDFNRVSSIADIPTIFRERSTMKFTRFSPENYIQTHIAWGLCLIATGKPDEGESHLQIYCAHFEIDRDDRILRQAEQEALRAMRPTHYVQR
jgi:hypothetical protein